MEWLILFAFVVFIVENIVHINKPWTCFSRFLQQARDPRFDSLSGNFNQDLFEKSYAFLEDYRKAEVEQLTKELKKTKNEERRRELQAVLSRMVWLLRKRGVQPALSDREVVWRLSF